MYKSGWKEYIMEIKLSLKYLQKELDTYSDDVDIRATLNEVISGELKDILQKTTELL